MLARGSIVVGAVVVALWAAGAPEAEPPAGAAAKRATARVLTVDQGAILRSGRIRVRIRARRAGTVRLVARAHRGLGRGKGRRVSRTKVVRFGRAGRRSVRLRLTRSGRRMIARCEPLRLSVRGRWRGGARASARGFALRSSKRQVRHDAQRCRRAALAERLVSQIELGTADRCDFVDETACLYPWPNDRFTVRDSSTGSGRRLNLSQASMPKNRFGAGIEAAPYNLYDGFSPGNMIVTKVPGLETPEAFQNTGAVPITDVARSYDESQPVVVVNARTKERQLIWSEIDSNPDDTDDVTLIIRPAVNFAEGERYIVALRNLKNATGETIPPSPGFRLYRDALETGEPEVERRRAHFEDILGKLAAAGIERGNLYRAWDFTVASETGLSRRALSIRDDAFAQLGDVNLADLTVQGNSPTFVRGPIDVPDEGLNTLAPVLNELPIDPFEIADGRRDLAPCSAGDPSRCETGESDTTARIITGQLTVPCYLDTPGCPPGSRFSIGDDGRPTRIPGNLMTANVMCTIPRVGLTNGPTLRVSLYGHGLLGSATEVGAGNVQAMGNEHGFVFCATDWSGMSIYDAPNVVTILQDLSRFPTLADRAQQGFVNQLYLGRWMIHPSGLSAHPDFQLPRTYETRRLFYDGNSQGGIMGGALAALAVDHDRAVLGVPGMNYSTLLRRSVDFDPYANGNFEGAETGAGLYQNYPDELERPLILSLIQLHWDRGEANGYAHHMTSKPYPNTPPHNVLLHPAFGDHQVADVTVEVEARTIGAGVLRPVTYPGRHPYVEPYFAVPTLKFPFSGSGVVVWDSGPVRTVNGQQRGTPPSPNTNTPPREGSDPHSRPRSSPAARQQKAAFLSIDGALIDVCGGGPCYSDGFTGP